jgi:HlyD family secretion protein
MKRIIKNKWVWIIGGVLLLAGLFVLGPRRDGGSDAVADASETAVAFIGDLAESASASGQVAAGREASLSLAAAGRVDRVNVTVGDAVKAGDVLVQLDAEALERAVASAELDVTVAQADLEDLLAAPTAEELAAAEASVVSAQARLDDLVTGPSEQEVAASAAGVRAAEAKLASAQADLSAVYDVSDADIMTAEDNLQTAKEQQQTAHDAWVRLADCEVNESGTYSCTPSDRPGMEAATQNVEAANAQVVLAQAQLDALRNPDTDAVATAQAGLAAAQAQYDAAVARHAALLLGTSDADIAAAQADLASAQASLGSLRAGPSETDVAIYRIRVAQAETGLQEAQNAVARASLVAPFDGVVTAVYVREGEQAAGLAVDLVDERSREVVLSVDQVDIGRTAVGQTAVVTLETWPGVEIEGRVTAIAPSATDSSSGVVSYEVHLALAETDLPVRVGMTANADLVTARRENVLLVPNAAITADREAGTFSVSRVRVGPDGRRTVTPVEVSVGLRDSEYTQITAGLAEGDEVLLGQLRASTQQDFTPGQGAMGR